MQVSEAPSRCALAQAQQSGQHCCALRLKHVMQLWSTSIPLLHVPLRMLWLTVSCPSPIPANFPAVRFMLGVQHNRSC